MHFFSFFFKQTAKNEKILEIHMYKKLEVLL